MSSFTFKCNDPYNSTTKEFKAMCWDAVTDCYIEFLRGCGFVLTKQEVAEYLKDRVTEYENANERPCGNDVCGCRSTTPEPQGY